MLKLLLFALLGICSVYGQSYEVKIQYTPPNLSILVPVVDPDVTSVLFHYGSRINSQRTARGVAAADGWEYYHDFPVISGDVIYAYADIQYKSGLLITTPHVTLLVP
ncbi:hypothetical protein BsWGS_15817 [Bradybaena similaris]